MSETPTVLREMADIYPRLSKSHRRIVDVILQDPETSAFYNVSELAQSANVSDATVTRFARALGYNGFPELSRQLQSVVRMRLTTGERLEKVRTTDRDTGNDVWIRYIQEDVQNLQMFLNDLDIEGLEMCAKKLIGCRKIGIVCSRSTSSLGLFFQFYLNFLRKETILIDGDPKSWDRLTLLDPEEDVVIGIGFSRYSRFTVNSLKYLREKGMRVYAITDYPASPLAENAAKSFYCPTGIASHMDSFVAPLALLQALTQRMSSELYANTMDELKRLEEIWELFSVYYHSNEEDGDIS